jgi:hypothetical protein
MSTIDVRPDKGHQRLQRGKPEFSETASPRPDPTVQARVEALVVKQYTAGRSLRQLAELTDRSFSAARNILSKHGVHRRGSGAESLRGPSA